MSKKSRKKEKKAPASSEAAIDATAEQDALTQASGEETESLHEAITEIASDADSADSNDTEVMEKSETSEELEVSVDLEDSSDDSALPEAVTEEALSGDVPAGEIPRLSHIIEAILFASQKAVTPKELVAHLKSAATAEPTSVASAFARIKEANIHEALVELQAEVAASGRAYQVRETATGWLLTSAPGFAPWLRALYPEAKPTRLSPSALETLAIIAYRQPIARADMEAVRGVSVDGVMQTLLDRGLVKISGRAEVAGRPLLYATTQYFLDHFGLRHLDELPNAAELRQVQLPTATPEPTESDAGAASEAKETDPELPGESAEGTSSQEPPLDEEATEVPEEVEVTEILELREAVVFSEVTFDSDATQENANSTSEVEEKPDDQTDSSEEEPEHPHS